MAIGPWRKPYSNWTNQILPPGDVGWNLKELIRHINSTEDANSGARRMTNEAEKESAGSRQVWLQGESEFALVPDFFWLMVPGPWMARLHFFPL